MKKMNFLLAFLLSLFFSCEKNEQSSLVNCNGNSAIQIMSDTKSAFTAGVYSLSIHYGHLANDCTGCTLLGGVPTHIDCMGQGNVCETKASMAISLMTASDYYQAVTLNEYDLTTEDFFLMPDRSLLTELLNGGKVEVWLNIPEQLAVRDSVTGMFTFIDLFFTSYPVYKNQ